MSALQKLKAYFGMVPADYDYDYDYDDRRGYSDDDYDGYGERPYKETPPRRPRPRYHVMDEFDDPEPPPARTRRRVEASEPPVHGSLAVDRQPDPVARLRPAAEPARQPARDPLSRIITLHPTSYVEAREIGEAYRDGTPVIINLTEMANADAKRLVDFAAGLAFALRGSMDKVTNKVFLLSPPDVDVTAEDRRRIAEGGLFLRH
ncbi:cell division inhibitor SepF [Saccharomonospora amisosensis]|uniref:Cell division protein SepF n=1 Tax=Saccharomonospora amisosensis TaxID=1128677 RepID=A0A7X5UNJ2_9PSEU|nr:cell division protein SepF [Saccharomonospora amisosensis]NIJ11285.1 cell division inhibitor SepF [Saccharomonospora amisosensis]